MIGNNVERTEMNNLFTVNQKSRPYVVEIDHSPEVSAFIHHRGREKSVEELKEKTGFLMISIKNKSFSNRLLEAYIDFVQKYLDKGFITIVDKPYIHNVNAIYTDPEQRLRELEKLDKIANENNARVQRLIRKKACNNIEQVYWNDLELSTPAWIVEEIESAFLSKGNLYRDILERTMEVIPEGVITDLNADKYAQFLVKEMPILLHQYYFTDDKIVDIYPGENPDFLWKVEAGYYSDELPGISQAAVRGDGLTYIDFQMRK